MSRNWFRRGQRIELAGRECVIENRLANGDLQLKDAATCGCFTKSYEDLVGALFAGQLKIPGNDYAPGELINKKKAKELMIGDFAQMPQARREEAKRRLGYVTEIRKRNISGRTPEALRPIIKEVAQATGDPSPPSWRTLCRWYHRYLSSGENVRSLVPFFSGRGNRKRRLQPGVIQIIDNVIDEEYLKPQRITVQTVFEKVALRIKDYNRCRRAGEEPLKVPDKATVYRTVAKLDAYEKMAARYGKRIADLKFGAFKQGVRLSRPLERVEIDHTKLDLFVVDPERGMPIGRPWLTSAIDVFTKSVLGYYMSFNPPGYLSVMQCLRHAIAPKSYLKKQYPSVVNHWGAHGLPEMVVVDNGKEFHSTHLEEACLDLGILIQYAPIRLAWYKGSVERYFGSQNTGLLHQQPGTTFSNIFDKGDYDPAENAIIDMKTLDEVLHVWIVDDYHRREHKGIKNLPAVAWEDGIAEYPPALPSGSSELDVLLGMIEERTVSPSGVELHGLLYSDDALAMLRRGMDKGDKVKVKYDPTDLSIIHVFDASNGTFIPVPAANQAYTRGLTLWQHEVIKRVARTRVGEKVDIAALGRAKETVEELVKRGWAKTKRNITRQKMARYLKHGEIDHTGTSEEPQRTAGGSSVVHLDAKRSRTLTGRGIDSARGVSDPAAGSPDVKRDEAKGDLEDRLPQMRSVEDVGNREKEGETKKENSMKKRGKAKEKPADPASTAPETIDSGKGSNRVLEDDEELDTTGWDADQDLPSKEEKA